MKSLYREKKFFCGDYLEVNIFPVFCKARTRGKKRKPTSDVQKRLNQLNAERRLIRLLNTNFTPADIRFDLTYSDGNRPATPKDAQKCLQNFLRRLKRFRKRLGLGELKYVATTEVGSRTGRIHHHIVMSGGVDINELARIWGLGYTAAKPLQFDELGITGIALYLVKDPVLGKRWCASKNLEKPKERSRDGRISKRKLDLLANAENRAEEFEKLYVGYSYAAARPFFNDVNGGSYLTVWMYKREEKRKRKRGKE